MQYSRFFSFQEMEWLAKQKKLIRQIDEFLKDGENVNPLENGEPDLRPFNNAIAIVHLTIAAAIKKIISGPYDEEHWQMIRNYLSVIEESGVKETLFWNLFAFQCACKKEEDEDVPVERIYMNAMQEICSIEGLNEISDPGGPIADLNTGSTVWVSGEGVKAVFLYR